MTYITVRGRVESFDDASYPRTVKKNGKDVEETVQKWQLSLALPGSSEMLQFDLAPEVAPTQAQGEQWEMDETWVVVEADAMRRVVGTSQNSGKAYGIVSFTGVEVREMSAQEKQAMQTARKKAKQAKKQKREEAKKQKQATQQQPAA